ncbi:MAG: CIA30 family protein [Geminicoccaceae bacterium]
MPLAGWEGTSDRVMGGISRAEVRTEEWGGRCWLRLTGEVRLENQGGFIQMGVDLAPDRGPVDLSGYGGIRLVVRGNGELYGCHLRTTDCRRPWQSYRQAFIAPPEPVAVLLPFADFVPHRVETPLDPGFLRRLALVAIGRAFTADLAVAEVAFQP